jgi:hypothetical protein
MKIELKGNDAIVCIDRNFMATVMVVGKDAGFNIGDQFYMPGLRDGKQPKVECLYYVKNLENNIGWMCYEVTGEVEVEVIK